MAVGLVKPEITYWTVGRRLALMGLVLATPLSLLLIATIAFLASATHDAQKTSLHYSARSIAVAVDARLNRYSDLARALAAEPELLNDDLSEFEVEAKRTFADIHDAWPLVADPDGQQLMSLGARSGQPLPKRDPVAIEGQQRSIAAGTAVVSDVFMRRGQSDWLVAIELPVLKDGKPFRHLAVAMDSKGFSRLLNAQEMPRGWRAGIMD